MRSSIPIYSIPLPEYRAEPDTDWLAVGRKLDQLIEAHFEGRIAIRGIGLVDHPGRSLEDLIAIVLEHGTDRYDPAREGLDYSPCDPPNIAMHAAPHLVAGSLRSLRSKYAALPSAMAKNVSLFYSGALADRGYPVRLDLLMIYDLDLLEVFPVDSDWPPEESCCFTFSDPVRKQGALLGIIKLLRD